MIDLDEEIRDAVPREQPPRASDLAAALVVFVGLPCAIAYVAVSLYMGSAR